MKITFQHPTVSGGINVSDRLADFFVWLSRNREDERAISLLSLLAEHDRENNEDERKNIRRTLDEILANDPIYLGSDEALRQARADRDLVRRLSHFHESKLSP